MDIHEYQLKLFGIAFAIYALFWSAKRILTFYNIDNLLLERGLGWVAIIIFAVALLHYRDAIWTKEIKQLTVWTLILWIILGVALIGAHLHLKKPLQMTDLFFLIFTIFLADSYWDFRDIPSAHEYYKK